MKIVFKKPVLDKDEYNEVIRNLKELDELKHKMLMLCYNDNIQEYDKDLLRVIKHLTIIENLLADAIYDRGEENDIIKI